MVETPILITMLAAIASLIGVVFESFRRSRCVTIKSCCGLFEIEREVEDKTEQEPELDQQTENKQ